MKKILLTIIAVLAVAGGAAGYAATKNEPAPARQTTQTSQQHQPKQAGVSYQGVEGKNALELLKQKHKVTTKTYDGLGELVTAIDGTAPDSKHFWSFYVNGQPAQVGAEAYVTKNADTITWKLEEIQ